MTSARFDAAALGRAYDVPAVRAQRTRTKEPLRAVDGTVLDLGCGPGHLSAELAATARVVAVDREAPMLTATRERAGAGAGVLCVQADATALPLADGSVDAAAVVQVLEYVPDLARALAELRRVLRPGGRAVLVDTDWRSCVWHSDDRDRTDRVLRLWEEHFVHPHLPAALPGLARAAGFADVAVHALPLVEVSTTSDTYSRGMLGTISRFVGHRAPELADAWRADLRGQAERGTWWFSLTRTATVVTRG